MLDTYLYPTVNCEWAAWQLGDCDKSCGTGERIKSRTKIIEEAHGGSCPGLYTETEPCNTQMCPGKMLKIPGQVI